MSTRGWIVWKRMLVLVGLLTLGCTGLTESIVEISTGGQMEISDNGDVVMTLPDGTKVTTENGGVPPEGFPLPPPWDGAMPQTIVTTTNPDGKVSYIATYEMERPRAEIAARYEGWLKEHGSVVKHESESTAGIVAESIVGKVADGAVVISLTEAFGANSVSAIWAPEGMDGLPD